MSFEDKKVTDREHLEIISYCTEFEGVPACVTARVPVLGPLSLPQFEPSPWDGVSVSWERVFAKTECVETVL